MQLSDQQRSQRQKEVLDMEAMQRRPGRLRRRNSLKMGMVAMYAVFGFLFLAVLAGLLATPTRSVFAASTVKGNEPWLEINCLENVVEEGDDFRLVVYKKFHSDWPHKTMRVFWYTEPITADETDYERLYAEGQASNEYQSKHGRMGRDFHTVEDLYPEVEETFKVRFNNSVGYGHDGECIITITDDDGVGIHKLEITSKPGELPSESEDGEPIVGYATGDVIEIKARFTGDVTNVNPKTGEDADYMGIRIQVGENRRVAKLLRGEGTDTLTFGYTVRESDLDADGVSVEYGGPRFPFSLHDQFTGFRFNRENFDIGLWPVSEEHQAINRFYRGLDDDPDHMVVQVESEEPTLGDPDSIDIDVGATTTPPSPAPEMPFESAPSISVGLIETMDGELTSEDEGRDWFGFDATAGENYIIELKNMMEFVEDNSGLTWLGGHLNYVEGHLIDPSILEVVDDQGEQVLGEHDQGGFMANFARAFFVPDEDGTYYIAVGAGAQDRGGTGFYTLTVRVDDHADDYHPDPGVLLSPGQSITGVIDSDVSPDDPGLNEWDWAVSGNEGVPVFGVESLDDRDVFTVEISESGTYRVSVSEGPTGVGIWSVMKGRGNLHGDHDRTDLVESFTCDFEPGTYYVEVGTPYLSEGNVGSYTVSVEEVEDDSDA